MARITGPNGTVVNVDSENRLQTFSTAQTLGQSLNLSGNLYTADFSVTPAGANDFFFYMTNNGTIDIGVGPISVSSSVPTKVTYEFVTGTPVFIAETDAGVTNRNLGSTNDLLADLKVDTDITGLVSEGVLSFEECAVADTRYELATAYAIIIPQGKAMAFRRVEATGQIDISFAVGPMIL